MFLVSAALVGVAIVLLALGMATAKLTLVYLAIGVSVVSMILLGLGVFLQRELLWGKKGRGSPDAEEPESEPEPVAAAARSAVASPAATGSASGPERAPAASRHPAAQEAPETDEPPAGPSLSRADLSSAGLHDEPAAGELVHVVMGRRRYHRAGCASLVGRVSEELTHDEAREEGFSACTTCFPSELDTDAGLDTAPGEPGGSPADGAPESAGHPDGQPGAFVTETAAHSGAGPATAEPGSVAPEAAGPGTWAETGEMEAPGRPEDSATPAHGLALGDVLANAAAPEAGAGPEAAAEPGAGASEAAPGTSGSASTTVWVVRGVSRYHRNDCVLIRSVEEEDVDTMTQGDAEAAGCTPCRACHAIDEPLAG